MEKMKLNIQLFSIPHTYIEFEDYPSTNTPLTAANLNQMQSDIYDDIRENGGGSGETLKVGTILQYSGTTAPTGYMFCDGTAISRTEYATLFEVIGTTYGSGDGSTTFNLPNFNGRVPVGLDSNDTDFDTLGETGGEKTHTLTTNEMPSHNHRQTYYLERLTLGTSDSALMSGGTGATIGDSNQYTTNVGGGQAHNNLQPYLVVNYIIKVANTTPVSAQIVDSYSTSTTDGYSANYVNNVLGKIGKSLWTGSFTSGTINVQNLSNYSCIGVVADGVLMIGNKSFGGGIYGKYGGTNYGICSYRLASNGDVFSITDADKGAFNNGTQVAITEIIGIF